MKSSLKTNYVFRTLFSSVAAISLWPNNFAVADNEVWVACIDCYGTAALYPSEARKLLPNKTIRWIHVQTETEIQSGYRASFDATKHEYEGRLYRLNPNNPDEVDALMRVFREKNVLYAFGGLETGAMRADPLNERLFQEGLAPERLGNDPKTVDLRRRKASAQAAVGEEFQVPTLYTSDVDQIVAFAREQEANKLVLKPDASSASDHTLFLKDTNPQVIRDEYRYISLAGVRYSTVDNHMIQPRIDEGEKGLRFSAGKLLQSTDYYGQPIDRLVAQPEIDGDEYVANTIVKNGNAVLVAVWKYIKIDLPGGIHSYFLDVPIDLNSPIAEELRTILPTVHHRLGTMNGPGHSELFRTRLRREPNKPKWYFGEQAARVAGTGIPLIDQQVWGTSHLHLNLLRVLDPNRYEKEVKTFPRGKLRDAVVVSLLTHAAGKFRRGANRFIETLPHFFLPAPFYKVNDGDAFGPTKDLNSIAATIAFVGPTQEVRESATHLIQAAASGDIYDYEIPKNLISRCKFAVDKLTHRKRLNSRLRSANWE